MMAQYKSPSPPKKSKGIELILRNDLRSKYTILNLKAYDPEISEFCDHFGENETDTIVQPR